MFPPWGSNAGGRKRSWAHTDSPSFLCPLPFICVLFDPPRRRRQLLPRCLGRSFGRSFWKQGSALLTTSLSLDHGYNLLAPSPLNTLKVKSKTFKLRMPQTSACSSWIPALKTFSVPWGWTSHHSSCSQESPSRSHMDMRFFQRCWE